MAQLKLCPDTNLYGTAEAVPSRHRLVSVILLWRRSARPHVPSSRKSPIDPCALSGIDSWADRAAGSVGGMIWALLFCSHVSSTRNPLHPSHRPIRRSTGLMVFGVVQIVCGAFAALFIPLALFGAVMASKRCWGAGKAGLAPSLFMYALAAVVLIVLGVGSTQKRRWVGAVELQGVLAALALDAVAAVARVPLEGVVAGAQLGAVGADVAVDEVVAGAADEGLGAVAARERVVAGAAVDGDVLEGHSHVLDADGVVAAAGVDRDRGERGAVEGRRVDR